MKTLYIFLLLLIFSSCPLLFAADEPPIKSDLEVSENGLYFPALLNGIQTNISELAYVFADDRASITIGPTQYKHNSLTAQLIPLGKTEFLFLVTWPVDLIHRGELVRVEKGKPTWSRTIDEAAVREWDKLRSTLELGPAFQEDAAKAGYGFKIGVKDLATSFRPRKPFIFCFLDPRTNGTHRACSGGNVLVRKGKGIQFRRLAGRAKAGVAINGKNFPLRGIFPYEKSQKLIQFRAQLSNGATYQFDSQPTDLKIADVVRLDNQDEILVRGSGAVPYGSVRFSEREPDVTPLMDRSLYPEAPRLWSLRVPAAESFLYLPGMQGGIFRHPIFIDKIPTEAHRLTSPEGRVHKTYSSSPRVSIEPAKTGVFKINDGQRLENRDKELTTQTWELKEAEKGVIKTYNAQIADGQKFYSAEVPVYRGYSYEISSMLGGAAQANSLAVAGELRLYGWYETFFGCRNWLLCHQRWGTRARYFQSNSVVSIDGRDDLALTTTSLQTDAYYRLSQGIWGVDEFVGLIFGFQDLTFNEFNSKRLGTGFTWGRQLPGFFQPLFDIAPFMQYPKWVHMDFTYYPLSLDPNVTLNFNWTLNFQGRIHWGEQFYGEVGFGMSSTDFILVDEQQKIVSGAFFGTMGLGLRF